jgi:hypothetical protein
MDKPRVVNEVNNTRGEQWETRRRFSTPVQMTVSDLVGAQSITESSEYQHITTVPVYY